MRNLIVTCVIALVGGCSGDIGVPVGPSENELSLGSQVATVPGTYPTLQAAIDNGKEGTIRLLGGYNHAPAIVTRPVVIEGVNGARIVPGALKVKGYTVGLQLTSAANWTIIRGVRFHNMDFGIVAGTTIGGVPNLVTITNSKFINNAQAITVSSTSSTGQLWQIRQNQFYNLRSNLGGCGGGIGIALRYVNHATIADNLFNGTLGGSTCSATPFTTTGIYATGTSYLSILDNDFSFSSAGGFDIFLEGQGQPNTTPNLYSLVDANTSTSNRLAAAPDFVSFGDIDPEFTCNKATFVIDGMGFSQDGC